MRRFFFYALSSLVCPVLLFNAAFAESHNAADYPLRVHIVQNTNHAHYRLRMLDYVDGEGRANLFENSQSRGFDYDFRCDDRLMVSPGYETYPARWHQPGRELDILEPVMGKPGAGKSCTLKVDMKDMVYIRRNGLVDQQSPATFKQWMDRRQYDPEHGKIEPVPAAPAPADTTASQ